MTGVEMQEMARVQLGPVCITAPLAGPVRHVRGVYGDLWQLIGDGQELVSVTVSSKRTPMGTADGVREHLDWEAQRQVTGARRVDVGASRHDLAAAEESWVGGARYAAKVVVPNERRGVSLHNVLVGTSDGASMQVTHIAMLDTERGRELGETMAASIRLQETQ